MLRWHAHESRRMGGKLREPTLGENFSGIESITDALVRESIQNSLDARLDSTQPVHVRFFVSGSTGALSPSQVSPWTERAWEHLAADDYTADVSRSEPCQFVVIEDFNTKGLQGDVTQCPTTAHDGEPNPWLLFFRVEGRSRKSDEDRGRWGIGKVVFPVSSRARMFLAATVRADDRRRLVMGQAMLRSRKIGSVSYEPDLWFCNQRDDSFELPSDNQNDFKLLSDAFRLSRANEPGLSVVIPFADASIDHESLLASVIAQYFFPILNRRLVVTIESEESSAQTVDAGSLATLARSVGEDARESLVHLVDMAAWLIDRGTALERTSAPDSAGRLSWNEELIAEPLVQSLRSGLDAGLIGGVRVSCHVIPATGPTVPTYLDVVLKRLEKAQYRKPIYVRSDLVIPEVKGKQLRGFLALVVATDAPLVTLLGDAENPAHTDWHVPTLKAKRRYKHAPSQLEFVRNSARNILDAITVADGLQIRDALADYFAVTDDDIVPEPTPRGRKQGKDPEPPPDPPPAKVPKPFSVEQANGGLVLSSTSTQMPEGFGIEVIVAYDIRGGDPLAKYHPADFKISQLPRSIERLRVASQTDNGIVVIPVESAFRMKITGFDPNRDLFIRARAVEVER